MARSPLHAKHLAANQSWNNCEECRADRERTFAAGAPFQYRYVHEYLTFIRPRLEAIRTGSNGGNTLDARLWHRDFLRALHTRISSRAAAVGRKQSAGYLERLRMAAYPGSPSDAVYLRRFAQHNASALD